MYFDLVCVRDDRDALDTAPGHRCHALENPRRRRADNDVADT